MKSKNRIAQNPEIVSIWKFVEDFYKVYYHAKSGMAVCIYLLLDHLWPKSYNLKDSRVTQKDIQAALGVHETWLNEAMAAARWVNLYGPDGPFRAQEVITELSVTRVPPLGRVKLTEFLEKWEETHPTVM